MQLKSFALVFLFLLFLFSLFPLYSSKAQECGLVPCGRKEDCPQTAIDEREPCGFCHLLVLGKRIVDFTVTFVAIPLAILVIALGGVFLMTAGGEPKKIAQGKEIIKNALIGVAIILGGWLLIDWIISFFTPASSPFQHWSQIKC